MHQIRAVIGHKMFHVRPLLRRLFSSGLPPVAIRTLPGNPALRVILQRCRHIRKHGPGMIGHPLHGHGRLACIILINMQRLTFKNRAHDLLGFPGRNSFFIFRRHPHIGREGTDQPCRVAIRPHNHLQHGILQRQIAIALLINIKRIAKNIAFRIDGKKLGALCQSQHRGHPVQRHDPVLGV